MKEKDQSLDPDVRFLLANERTLLAWIRTGLTLQAGGFALVHFSSGSYISATVGIAAVALGGVLAVIGFARFRSADQAIRAHRLPAMGKAPLIQTIAVVLVAIIITTTLLFDLYN